ncbi:hypothetical protein ABI59_18355 [Acidobacteria bacterium Mor1]|nr:hypothetical protein ABI59_18355 [Acidobacteria bacterium Mor1]
MDATVADAVRLMQERSEGCVFVMDGERLAGVLTERDVTRVISRGLDPTRTKLDRAMTPEPMRLREEDPLAWALHRMGVDGYRHIPVTREGGLRGVLSARSVLRRLLD